MNSKPIAMPTIPPSEQNMRECHSSCTRIQKIVKAAAVIPQDWIISEKSRATAGDMLKARVMTGKATAPPPSLVIPKQKRRIHYVLDKSTVGNWRKTYDIHNVELYFLINYHRMHLIVSHVILKFLLKRGRKFESVIIGHIYAFILSSLEYWRIDQKNKFHLMLSILV